MKLSIQLILIILIKSSLAAYYCHYHFKSKCFSSNKTLIIDKCRTIPVKRYRGAFILEAHYIRSVSHMKIDFDFFYKSPGSKNFNPIARLRESDFCTIKKNAKIMPWKPLSNCMISMPHICHECPYKVNEILSLNYSLVIDECPSVNNTKKPTLIPGFWWPDGDYKTSINITFGNNDYFNLQYYFRENNGDTKGF